MTSMVDGAAHTTSYAYDQLGRLTSRTDARGKTVHWKYDELGRQIRQENRSDPPSTASITWTYDGAGRQLTRTADSVTTTTTYDANGNRLTVTTGSQVINATYDRLNRPLTVDDEDALSVADTTYTYSLTSPSWTDPTGTYGVTLDKFDRATAINDPVNASDFTTTYRADGQRATFGQPNGNTTDFAYDTAGHLTGSDGDTSGGTDRAVYAWTYNRAGQVLTEASTITGDASNGTVTYAYDALGRLTSASMPGTSAAYGWDAVPNRTSLTENGGTPELTVYDAANRPTSGTTPTAAYTSDDDGRLLTQPGQQFVWDHLGRLTQIKNAGGTTLATYSYDPLDRLRLVGYGGSNRIRFRYVGLTTSAAQWIDDLAGTVTRSIGTGWTGERLLDWTGAGSNIRIYGENAHHDVTWLASNTGTVSQALRYDPWGTPRVAVPTGYTPFRFQGSWFDDTTALSWVVTRWYAPNLGRFISEDSLLGNAIDPPSRHLYAYGQGEPVGRWDPDGQHWYATRSGDTVAKLSARFYGSTYRQNWITSGNPGGKITPLSLSGTKSSTPLKVPACIWIPFTRRQHECRKANLDSIASGSVLWARFDAINSFMVSTMRARAKNNADGLGNIIWGSPTNIAVLVRWAQLMRDRGPWDIKYDLIAKFSHTGRFFWTAVRDDPAPESLRSDLWGLVNYGYLGRAHGIDRISLRLGNQYFGGVQGPDDTYMMEVGMSLWDRYGYAVTTTNLRLTMRASMSTLRRMSGTGVKVPLTP